MLLVAVKPQTTGLPLHNRCATCDAGQAHISNWRTKQQVVVYSKIARAVRVIPNTPMPGVGRRGGALGAHAGIRSREIAHRIFGALGLSN